MPAKYDGKAGALYALTLSTRIRNRVERRLTGRAQFVDNLGDSLSTAAGDALYAETLFIMLAVPGALVGLGLAYLAALGAAERERRELALLRARGASRRRLVGLAAVESFALGVPAGVLGAVLALGALRLLAPSAVHAARSSSIRERACAGTDSTGACATVCTARVRSEPERAVPPSSRTWALFADLPPPRAFRVAVPSDAASTVTTWPFVDIDLAPS